MLYNADKITLDGELYPGNDFLDTVWQLEAKELYSDKYGYCMFMSDAVDADVEAERLMIALAANKDTAGIAEQLKDRLLYLFRKHAAYKVEEQAEDFYDAVKRMAEERYLDL